MRPNKVARPKSKRPKRRRNRQLKSSSNRTTPTEAMCHQSRRIFRALPKSATFRSRNKRPNLWKPPKTNSMPSMNPTTKMNTALRFPNKQNSYSIFPFNSIHSLGFSALSRFFVDFSFWHLFLFFSFYLDRFWIFEFLFSFISSIEFSYKHRFSFRFVSFFFY